MPGSEGNDICSTPGTLVDMTLPKDVHIRIRQIVEGSDED
jgi:hypothetical protein